MTSFCWSSTWMEDWATRMSSCSYTEQQQELWSLRNPMLRAIDSYQCPYPGRIIYTGQFGLEAGCPYSGSLGMSRLILEDQELNINENILQIRAEEAEAERAKADIAEAERAGAAERAEREKAERAESLNDQLRAELLDDRHTILMLPGIRKWLYEMSFRDPTKCRITQCFTQSQDQAEFDSMLSFTEPREISQFDSISLGDNEQFFQVFNDFVNIANTAVYNSFYNVIVLSRLIKKAEKNGKLREVLANIMSKSGTVVSVNEQLQFLKSLLALFPNSVSFDLESAFDATVVSAVVLLCFVYQYLMGSVDRGGPKTYSSGSLNFRDMYVSIVLLQGAYIWIKFRQAARSGCLKRKSCESQGVQVRDGSSRGVYARAMKDKSGTITHYKYEPRFKPPREKLDTGKTLQFDCLSLGQYNTPGEAKIVRQIAAFYYGKGEGRVALEDGFFFSIPAMNELEKCLTSMDKAKWVTVKAKEVYEMLKQQWSATMAGAHSGPHGSDVGSDLGQDLGSSSAVEAISLSPASVFYSRLPSVPLVQHALSHGGDVSEQRAAPFSPSSVVDPIPATEQLSDLFLGNFNGVQYNVPDLHNGALAIDDLRKVGGHGDVFSQSISGFEDIIDELLYHGRPDIPPQQSNVLNIQKHHLGATEIFGDPCLPQSDGTTQGFGVIEPHLSSNLDIQQGCDVLTIDCSVPESFVTSGSSLVLKQRHPILGQVKYLQQLVNRQKKQLDDSEIRNVELQHQLCESEVQKSAMQQENDRLRTMLQQVAKSQAATWAEIILDIQQEEVGQFLVPNSNQANCVSESRTD